MEQNGPRWPTGPGGRRAAGREKWSLRKKLLVWGSSALAAVIVLGVVGVAVVWRHLNGNIKTENARLKPSSMNGKQEILFIGSDSRAGGNQTLGGGAVTGARSDTTMVFDAPADRRRGTEVSIPRDSMVQIPDCASTATSGVTVAANFGMFNSAFTEGGAPCTVKTVESLTGLTLTHYIAIDFEGVVGVVDALGGVKVCVTQAIDDADSGLDIPAGTTTLTGKQALAFVRLRHSVGDGSDLERIKRQQYFLDQLEQQVRSAGLLTDPVKLYKVLDAATQSITTDPGLGTVTDLYNLTQTLNEIPSGKITYVTVPNEPYPQDTNRVIWSEPAATNLWTSLIDETDPTGAATTSPAAALKSATSGTTTSAAALRQLESVMELEMLAANGESTGAGSAGTAAGTAGSTASAGATGTASPGGADVGTCAVS
ncbi:LCP family protein [Actinospica sp. MGRD01-02]|uniref:LCP family protein n=1 Tax=Actinospica acidithermotolerans TaxID=2828514 RepID=A0A941EAP6_9ACTN|nr:LCP family protein [Actinospica acidithermotolerans]MBR7826795.1 LCP family protein [Actinospica acidithermotolerans]